MKPSTDRMLTRIKSVYLFIKQKGSVSTHELTEEFGTTERTIQRDLHVLEYNDLVTPTGRGVWTTTDKKTIVS
ncbi:DeoR family transcriptional regulator [Alkalicoccus chagannorensis]|uniref:DeoR family transcriptional regulator n=1 Tax=Alkalicoccus chagannorensis TaxID=427072 RepID=UPI00047CBF7A|nr:DeoR family transcriptional regulator [Alkalicoccus chagannorensis]